MAIKRLYGFTSKLKYNDMNDTLINDTLNISAGQIPDSIGFTTPNYWLWIAVIELLIIIYLLFFTRKKTHALSEKERFKKDAKDGDVDFGNIINSSFHVKPLYDELKIKCHPDRFPNDENKNKIALDIFQEISKNKTNYKKLIELKEKAKNELNINFKS